MNICINSASIVAEQTSIGLTTNLTKTAIYTPATDGLFRISGYVEVPSAHIPNSILGTVQTSIYWTDATGSESGGTFVHFPGGNMAFPGGTLVIKASAGTAISVSAVDSMDPSVSYNLYIVLEQLA